MEIINQSLGEKNHAPVWITAKVRDQEVTYLQVDQQPLEIWPKDVCNEKQYEMYEVILLYRMKQGRFPSFQELQEVSGKAINTIKARLEELEKVGVIIRESGKIVGLTGETYVPPITTIIDLPKK